MSAADEPAEAMHVAGLEPGDTVLVEDQDGEHHRAIVAVIRDEPAGEYRIEPANRKAPVTIQQYWRPLSIGVEEPVVGVRFVKGVDWDGSPLTWSQRIVDYPASQLMAANFRGGEA